MDSAWTPNCKKLPIIKHDDKEIHACLWYLIGRYRDAAGLSHAILLRDMLILKSSADSLKCACLLHDFCQDLADALCVTFLRARVFIAAKVMPYSRYLRMKVVLGSAVAVTPLHCALLQALFLVTSVEVVVAELKGDHTRVSAARQRTSRSAHVLARVAFVVACVSRLFCTHPITICCLVRVQAILTAGVFLFLAVVRTLMSCRITAFAHHTWDSNTIIRGTIRATLCTFVIRSTRMIAWMRAFLDATEGTAWAFAAAQSESLLKWG